MMQWRIEQTGTPKKCSGEGSALSSETWKLERAAALINPALFARRILDYEVRDFHAKWLEFRLAHPETLILAPRGHGKSTILTVAYGLWRVIENPDRRLLIVSSAAAQAEAFLREMKLHVERNAVFMRVFGNLIGRKWTQNEIVLRTQRRIGKEASVTALGIGGPIIGRHYDIILLDDVIDEEAARTAHMREKLSTWFRKVLMPCREPGGELHLVGTRYHPRDLYGSIIESAGSVKMFPENHGDGHKEA